MKRKMLICGSTGFIGRNIAESFAGNEDFEVYGTYFRSESLKNSKLKMVKCDLTNKSEVDSVVKGMDVVIQAAAITSGSKDTFIKRHHHVNDNAVMNALLLKAAYDHKVSHVVFLSCSTMYQSSDYPIKEVDFDANKEIYPSYFGAAWTKVYNEKMCEFYSRISSTKYTVIRHSNIYGPHDKFDLEKSHVFGATITKVMIANEGGKVIVWGGEEGERDLLHVSDLVRFIELVFTKQTTKFELFNVGYGVSIPIKELIQKIIEHSGKNLKIEYDRTKPCIKTKICLDISKAKSMLGWCPEISLDAGINMTIEWYKNNIKIN